ncbi:MAG TPA: type II and III secretion system protein family protein [Acidisphaera sp.]|nr:type II and III secretion system protein family protein [Acidisphaera sp.]
MHHARRRTRLLHAAVAAALAASATASPARAADGNQPRTAGRHGALTIHAGMGQVLQLGAPAANIFVADPKVAEVRPASPTSLFVFGVGPGRTTVAALDAAGNAIGDFELTVLPSGYAAAATGATLGRTLPGSSVLAAPTANGMALGGTVRTPADADSAAQIARGFAGPHGTVQNDMTVEAGTTVNLRVRIVEMSRDVTRQIGINWSALAQLGKYAAIGLATNNVLPSTGSVGLVPSALTGGYNFNTPGHVLDINAVIDALAQDQLVHVLAEPNLTAISGEPASFLVGGEFPIPVTDQNNAISIEFKQFGVSLAFVPTVHTDGRITMKVRPEVSALTNQGAVTLPAGNNSIQVPALSVRRAETTVELGSGQSFAIAGLLQDSTTLVGTGLPFIGDVPILGALFRSDSFQRNETELVIVVTPYIVRPVCNPDRLQVPGGPDWRPPNDLERILQLRQSGAQASGGPQPDLAAVGAAHVPGDAGFVVQ